MDDGVLTKSGAWLRVGMFLSFSFAGQFLFPWLFLSLGLLAAAALGTFAAAGLATFLCLRVFERTHFANVGLWWRASSRKHLGYGLAIGVAAALMVTVVPVLLRLAAFRAKPETPFNLSSILYVSVLLIFGVFGEEILFRGYGFQILAAKLGRYQALLPISVLFAAAHADNANSSKLSLLITFLWGVVLGFAFLRSGDLWFPIGIHFGWNVTLPLTGVELSGFTMGLTGYRLVWNTGDLWSGGAYGPEGGLIGLLIIPLVFFAVYRTPVSPQTPYLMTTGEE